uniref:Microtubule-associated protein 9 n=1 Tax=Sphaeramia orbicularis TaxID=375764 RepID=A0A673C9K8_9TELE
RKREPTNLTLAYTKSPKTSKRTTFQDELEAAVSARASKTKAGQYSYSDDFNEDEDDFLNDLLKSRKKRVDTYKTGRSKAKVNNFDLSEDEGTPARTKRVSFLKTQRNSSPLEDTTASEHNENEPPDSSIGGCSNYSSSFSTQPSTNVNEDDLPHKQSDDESTNPQIIRESSSKSLSYQTSEDMPLPLQSESSILETPDPVVSDRNEERNQTPELSAGDLKPAESSAGLFFSKKQTSRSHCKTSQRPRSACTRKVESKYLGSLKILDISLQDSQPQEPNSMRAAVYQVNNPQLQDANCCFTKMQTLDYVSYTKQEQNAKKEDAVASYEAWKEKKAECLKAKAKEKQDKIRKEQRAIEEKEEKKQSAKQVFEKWKHEHDLLLKEKYRKEREAENKRNLQKQEEEEERKRGSTSAFSDWKDLEKKRQKEERYIQAILRDSPPPPWSPPNKTIPQGK